jgi:hypothetical protein
MNATRQRRRRGWRPLLEVLEDRLAPAAFTVNSTGDTGTGSGTAGDLRFCVNQADANPGSTIQFDPTLFAAAQTITLNGTALPDLTQNTQVNGPAAGVTVNAAGKSRVFAIDTGTAVGISDLSVTGGVATGLGGGGMLNPGHADVDQLHSQRQLRPRSRLQSGRQWGRTRQLRLRDTP